MVLNALNNVTCYIHSRELHLRRCLVAMVSLYMISVSQLKMEMKIDRYYMHAHIFTTIHWFNIDKWNTLFNTLGIIWPGGINQCLQILCHNGWPDLAEDGIHQFVFEVLAWVFLKPRIGGHCHHRLPQKHALLFCITIGSMRSICGFSKFLLLS